MKNSILKKEESSDEEIRWALLERVAASSYLNHAPRLREILVYIGRRSLKDHCDQIREQEIGIDVFGRPDSYDTGLDNIVRTNVSELRKRIDAYFDSDGLHEPLTMEVPRGSYVPVFRVRAVGSQRTEELVATSTTGITETPGTALRVPSAGRLRFWKIAALISFALAIGSWTAFWIQNREMQQSLHSMDLSLHPWRYQPSVAALWSIFLDGKQDTDIVISDSSFTLIQNVTKQSFDFNDYLSRSYLNQLQTRNLSSDTRAALTMIASKNLVSSSESRLAQHIQALDPLGKNLHLYSAREYMPALMKNDNLILIGGPVGNPWDTLLDSPLNFTVKPGGDLLAPIINRAPTAHEQEKYIPVAGTIGYCVVALLPTPNRNGKVLVIAGTSSEATEAAGDFLLSEDQLSILEKTPHSGPLPYFEVLLKASLVRGASITSTVETYRTYPDLH